MKITLKNDSTEEHVSKKVGDALVAAGLAVAEKSHNEKRDAEYARQDARIDAMSIPEEQKKLLKDTGRRYVNSYYAVCVKGVFQPRG
jgi:hypothetical protein